MSLVALQDVAFSYGGPPLFEGASFAIEPGDRAALLGRNGAGKSTLLKIVTGALAPTAGIVSRQASAVVAELSQGIPRGLEGAARDVVAGGLPGWGEQLARYHHLIELLPESPSKAQLAEIDRLQRDIEGQGGFQREPEIERALGEVAIEPDARWETLSVGARRRVLLARALVAQPALLVLDEPTNHLDVDAIVALEDFLLRFKGSLLFITHDRAFLRRVATRILVLDRGRLSAYDCGYDAFVPRREADLDARDKQEALADKNLAKEEAWALQGVKARRTRADARVRALEEMRADRRARRAAVGRVKAETNAAAASGQMVFEAKAAGFGYGAKPVIRDFEALIMRGDRVGVIGPNGSGKTTLLRLLLGELEPTSGSVRRGARLEIGYFDQLHSALDENRTVAQNVAEGDFVMIGARRRHVVGYLGEFLFRPEQVRASVKDLSGGERNRLLLARLFTRPTNVLVLDEPTNDLDTDTVDVLEELLAEYPGTVLLVSHDREFLNRVVTSTLALEGDGRVSESVGGYDDWLRQRAAQKRPDETAKKASSPVAAKPAPAGPRKRTYGESIELKALPAAIETLEAERRRIHADMESPAFYSQSADRVAAATARLDAIAAELEKAYSRWELLEGLAG